MKNIPAVTASQMKEIDRLMVEDLNISLIQMMENAGRNLAELTRSLFLKTDAMNKKITILVGTGGNGGGGLVCGRFLHNWGAKVTIVTSKDYQDYTGVPKIQLDILKKIGVVILCYKDIHKINTLQDVLVDAMIGYGLKGNPVGGAAKLIEWMNKQDGKKISLDIPSGLDATSGNHYLPTIQADATLTLGLPKTGLMEEQAQKYIGDLYLSDIGIPPKLLVYDLINIVADSIFSKKSIIKI